MAFVKTGDDQPAKQPAKTGEVTVVASKLGYYLVTRKAGDEFQMPLNKDGSEPKATWFKVKKAEAPKPTAKPESEPFQVEDHSADDLV